MLAGGKGPSLVSLGAWLIWLPISLGVGWLGILSLIAGKRTTEEAPPPAWTRAWCLVAIAPVIGGTPLTMPTLGLLLPLTAVGLADHLARMEREDNMRRRASLLLISQLVLGVLAWGTLAATDPLTAWREEAQETLDPEDLVFSAHPGHLYLLKHRYGIASWDPRGPEASKRALEATNQGQRVVLDGVLPDASPQLKAAATVVIGQPDG
jgi:hypothetical protein